jgi:predicted nucleic acid-binding protein
VPTGVEARCFLDASVLVTLCVNQVPTPQALLYESKYRIVVWWATQVEIASALVRSLRRQEITPNEFAHAKLQAKGIANLWDVIAPSAKVALDACAILERYPLRAADALQLAAALEWCEGKPKGEVFLTFDLRLREAAGLAGFALE